MENYVFVILPQNITQLLCILAMIVYLMTAVSNHLHYRKIRKMDNDVKKIHNALMNLPIAELKRVMRGERIELRHDVCSDSRDVGSERGVHREGKRDLE